MRTPTIHGLGRGQLAWQPDFQFARDSEGKWTGSISFLCHASDVTSLLPKKGAPCIESGFGFMSYESCSGSNYEGDLFLVNCKYSSGDSEEFEFDDEETAEGRREMAISTSEEPIETLYRYRTVAPAELLKIQELKSGRYVLSDPGTEGPMKFQTKVNEGKSVALEITSDLGKELASKVYKGILSYLQANQIYRFTQVTKSMPSADRMNSVGKITSALHAPSVGEGRNWLYVGCTVNEQGGAYTISYEWRLSGAGGWDADIYGGEEE